MGNDKMVKSPPRACAIAVMAAIIVVHTAKAILPKSNKIAKLIGLYTETSITNRYKNPTITATAIIMMQCTNSFDINILSGL